MLVHQDLDCFADDGAAYAECLGKGVIGRGERRFEEDVQVLAPPSDHDGIEEVDGKLEGPREATLPRRQGKSQVELGGP